MKTSLRRTVAGRQKKIKPYFTTICNATMQNERTVALPRQQWLREHYTVLLYTYTASLDFKFLNQFTVTMDDPKQCVKDEQDQSADSSAGCSEGGVLELRNAFCELEEDISENST